VSRYAVAAVKVLDSSAGEAEEFRLRKLCEARPDIIISHGEFGTLCARIPEGEDGETIVYRHTLKDLLGKLDSLLSPPQRT